MNTDKITEKVIACAYTVSNELGVGFLEKVYENALFLELVKQGLRVEKQKSILVTYRGEIVGEYVADLIVGDCVIIELKSVKTLDRIHQAQLLNSLKATGIRTGLLLNFGTSRIGIKRMVLGTEKP